MRISDWSSEVCSSDLCGLAGYALQGSPDLPTAAKEAVAETAQSGEAMVAARRSLFSPSQPVPSWLMVSDGFARQGRYMEAAQMLRSGLGANPGHGEGWLAQIGRASCRERVCQSV